MAFEHVIGRNFIKETLTGAIIDDSYSHAIAFSAPAGFGKRLMAFAFAASILCPQNKVSKQFPCGICTSCKTFEGRTHPDLYVIDKQEESISVDDIRQLQTDITIYPMYHTKKVYMILHAQNMTIAAQNALLKTLEEPPEYAVFILTCDQFSKLLETVRSRIVRIELPANTTQEVILGLKPYFSEDTREQRAEFLAKLSMGNIGRAIDYATSEGFFQTRDAILDFLSQPHPQNFMTMGDFFEKHKLEIESILEIFSIFLRDFAAVKTGAENNLINSDKKDMILKYSKLYTLEQIFEYISHMEKLREGLAQNANFALAIENFIVCIQG